MTHFLQGFMTATVLIIGLAYYPQIKNFIAIRFGRNKTA